MGLVPLDLTRRQMQVRGRQVFVWLVRGALQSLRALVSLKQAASQNDCVSVAGDAMHRTRWSLQYPPSRPGSENGVELL